MTGENNPHPALGHLEHPLVQVESRILWSTTRHQIKSNLVD